MQRSIDIFTGVGCLIALLPVVPALYVEQGNFVRRVLQV